jgi:hypothetical protein
VISLAAESGPRVFVVTRSFAALAALLVLVLLALLAHVVVVAVQPSVTAGTPVVKRRRRGIKALVMGADGRASTSKVQVVLWTFAVFYALVFLLVWGRSTGCGHTGLTDAVRLTCDGTASARATFGNVVNRPLQPAYYVLLGFPLAAAVAAKALTTGKVADGSLTKTQPEDGGVTKGLSEIVSNDQGDTDLLDFQYFAFNLLTLAFFAVEFLTKPWAGLPDLPPTLIALAGLSAATYTTKKALETDTPPKIVSVIPQRVALAPETSILVVGSEFGERAPESPRSKLLLEGVPLEVTAWQAGRIEARIPATLLSEPAVSGDTAKADLVVFGEEGPPSDPFPVEIYRP